MSNSFVTPQTITHHGISQARIWNGLPFSSPGNLPHSGIKPMFHAVQSDSLLLIPWGSRNLLELINELVHMQVTKLTHRNLLHFNTATTKEQKEKFKKQFRLPSKRIKYLGINYLGR